jgi:hypothetical protein
MLGPPLRCGVLVLPNPLQNSNEPRGPASCLTWPSRSTRAYRFGWRRAGALGSGWSAVHASRVLISAKDRSSCSRASSGTSPSALVTTACITGSCASTIGCASGVSSTRVFRPLVGWGRRSMRPRRSSVRSNAAVPAVLAKSRSAMTTGGRAPRAPSRMTNVRKALAERREPRKDTRSIAARRAIAVPRRVAATSAADRLAPSNSSSKEGGTRIIARSAMS